MLVRLVSMLACSVLLHGTRVNIIAAGYKQLKWGASDYNQVMHKQEGV